MSVENHIIKVSFCLKFQKAVKPKRSVNAFLITTFFVQLELFRIQETTMLQNKIKIK